MKRLIWLSLVMIISACGQKPELQEEPQVQVQNGQVVVKEGSGFLHQLELGPLQPSSIPEQEFQSVGQMLALANESGDLQAQSVSWVELDEGFNRSIGLNPKQLGGAIGTAYGSTLISDQVGSGVQPGQKVEISRYGLKKVGTQGVIVLVRPIAGQDSRQVIFRIGKGSDWYPGTNCEVHFPLVKAHPFDVPKTALLHEGTEDFLFIEAGPRRYEARRVSIIGEKADRVAVLGLLNSQQRLINRGAILLKPFLSTLTATSGKGKPHAP